MSAMIKLFLGPLKKWAYSDFMDKGSSYGKPD